MFNKRDCTPDIFPNPIPNTIYWTHDKTGLEYKFWSKIDGQYPQYAMMWVDGEFGGWKFVADDIEFSSTEGVRGIGYQAVAAFDSEGTGLIFMI